MTAATITKPRRSGRKAALAAVLVALAGIGPGLSRAEAGTGIRAGSPPVECPKGWVPRPPTLNPALGPCVPGRLKSASGTDQTFYQIDPEVLKKNQALVPPGLDCPPDGVGYFLAEVDGELWWIYCT